MNWGARRQVLIALGVVAFCVFVAGGVWYFFLYTPPTCSDTVRNQGEEGIDCGGVCDRICQAPVVDVLWARAAPVVDGIYHAVGVVQNPRTDARGTNIKYRFTLYGANNLLLESRDGTLDLEPGEVRAVFEPALATRTRVPQRTFLELSGGTWAVAAARVNPIRVVSQTPLSTTTQSLTATIENTSAESTSGVVAIALVYDVNDVLITASQARVASISPRARRDIVFTWPEALQRQPARTDIQVRIEAP